MSRRHGEPRLLDECLVTVPANNYGCEQPLAARLSLPKNLSAE
jgi:hypothetical protein